jgi:hypothetical protein
MPIGPQTLQIEIAQMRDLVFNCPTLRWPVALPCCEGRELGGAGGILFNS